MGTKYNKNNPSKNRDVLGIPSINRRINALTSKIKELEGGAPSYIYKALMSTDGTAITNVTELVNTTGQTFNWAKVSTSKIEASVNMQVGNTGRIVFDTGVRVPGFTTTNFNTSIGGDSVTLVFGIENGNKVMNDNLVVIEFYTSIAGQ